MHAGFHYNPDPTQIRIELRLIHRLLDRQRRLRAASAYSPVVDLVHRFQQAQRAATTARNRLRRNSEEPTASRPGERS